MRRQKKKDRQRLRRAARRRPARPPTPPEPGPPQPPPPEAPPSVPPDVGDGVALASWERFVGGPPPPAGQLAWIEAFARDAGRGPEDPALAALLRDGGAV